MYIAYYQADFIGTVKSKPLATLEECNLFFSMALQLDKANPITFKIHRIDSNEWFDFAQFADALRKELTAKITDISIKS